MGILKALFTNKLRAIKEYRFIEIAEDTVSPYMAQQFKEMLDSTKSFGWNSDDFYWHTFDDPSGQSEKSSISFNAKFVKEDESNNKIYLDTGETGSGENIFFYFSVAPSNEALYLYVKGDNDYTIFTVLVLLEKNN